MSLSSSRIHANDSSSRILCTERERIQTKAWEKTPQWEQAEPYRSKGTLLLFLIIMLPPPISPDPVQRKTK